MTPVCRPLPSRLLGAWAHPDDECYLSAGLMSRVIGAGGEVRLLCATRGERGTDDPELFGSEGFAVRRRAELEASLGVLGVSDVRFLGLSDGTCAAADDRRMVERVDDEITAFEPDVVVTFGPDGITGHPDHLSVSRWATAACAPKPTIELLYATMTHDHASRHREMHDSLGLFNDLDGRRAHSVGRDSVALQCSLDHGELIRKRRALAHHGSQTDGLAALMGEDVYFSWWRDETFRRPTAAERRRAIRHVPDLIGVGS